VPVAPSKGCNGEDGWSEGTYGVVVAPALSARRSATVWRGRALGGRPVAASPDASRDDLHGNHSVETTTQMMRLQTSIRRPLAFLTAGVRNAEIDPRLLSSRS
jgi:hypothetical protein